MKKCAQKYCRRKANHGRHCNTCHSKLQVEKDPVRRVFRNNKSNAKRRGHEHTITLEYFRELVLESGYMEGRGRTRDKMSMDRVNPKLGYVPGNIKIITVGENSRKKYLDYMRENQSEEDGIIIGEEADF